MLWKLKQRGQQWLAEEKGTIFKNWGGKVRIALAFPNRYAVGMSNLGFQTVYSALNQIENVVCERVFYPEPEDLKIIRKGPGNLLSVESQRPVADFHLFVFSIPFENDYIHALEMLKLAGIPVRAEERTEAHPLIAAGGVAVCLNPEPLALFLDFAFIGEAEALIPEFREVWNEFQNKETPREEFLTALASRAKGIYVPSLYQVAYRSDGTIDSINPIEGPGLPERVAYSRADLTKSPPCRTVILTPNTEFSNVTLLEIGRGCGRGCRFCAAGFVYRPVRYRSAETLIEAAKTQLPETSRIGLVSAAVSDHPEVSHLCSSLMDLGASLSFSSLRADSMSPEVLSSLEASRHQAVAIAPEAGSERLRTVINKNLTAEQIYTAAEELAARGILHLKLYFMIGLPTETLEDLEAIIDIAKGVKHHVLKQSRGQHKLGTITLSIHAFVPKPFTPFQWTAFAGVRELKEKARWIQKALHKIPNVRVHFDLPKWAFVQALLSRGDRRVGLFLEKVALEGLTWTQAMRTVPFNPDFWVMRERGAEERFPWEVVDLGVKRSYLWEEYQRALRAQPTPSCRPDEGCRRCGVCEP
ncbi:MAG: TIGR03960 family B12-binding radical SAM protein [Syntrophobacteraceae bacterium]